MSQAKVIQFVVGHTCEPVDDGGNNHHLLRWTLYLDVVSGNSDWIQKVTFDLGDCSVSPPGFISSYPIKMMIATPSSTTTTTTTRWRFQTRPRTTTTTAATINKRMKARLMISGAGGTRSDLITHRFGISGGTMNSFESPLQTFVERRPIRSLPMRSIPHCQKYGMELELTSAQHIDPATIGRALDATLQNTVLVIPNYRQARQLNYPDCSISSNNSDSHHNHHHRGWRLVPDSSIQCNRSNPMCNKFELVSPILKGGKGLEEIGQVIRTFQANDHYQLKVNKSMGFHVHVNVSTLTTRQLVNVCQTFIKYETVMDNLLPPSRRTGSQESDRYFRSNRDAITETFGFRTTLERHQALEHCCSKDITYSGVVALANLMNPNSNRFHKLNLQNLVTGRQPTLEFRQHSATVNLEKITSWIRFCINLVQNSASLPPPRPFTNHHQEDVVRRKDGGGVGGGSTTLSSHWDATEFNHLFQNVIKDRALRDYYRRRCRELSDANSNGNLHPAPQQQQFRQADNFAGQELPHVGGRGVVVEEEDHEEEYCCRKCAHGGMCASKRAMQ